MEKHSVQVIKTNIKKKVKTRKDCKEKITSKELNRNKNKIKNLKLRVLQTNSPSQ